MAGTRRLTKELAELHENPVPGVAAIDVDESNVFKWKVIIQGPEGTPYETGKFPLSLEFSKDYPFKGPIVRFMCRVYHPNVDEEGAMCIGILKSDTWKPSTKAATILMTIVQLLKEPEPDDALVASIAEQYTKDREHFDKQAKEYTQRFAKSG